MPHIPWSISVLESSQLTKLNTREEKNKHNKWSPLPHCINVICHILKKMPLLLSLHMNKHILEQGKNKKMAIGTTAIFHTQSWADYTVQSGDWTKMTWVWWDKQNPSDSEWTRDTTNAAQVILTSLKRCRGILPTSTGLRSAMFTNFASSTATAHITWTHLPGQKRGKRNEYALGQQRMLWSLNKYGSVQVCHTNHSK